MVVMLGLLYGFIFVNLQLSDYALLMGSLGLFVVLGVVMYISRKLKLSLPKMVDRDSGNADEMEVLPSSGG